MASRLTFIAAALLASALSATVAQGGAVVLNNGTTETGTVLLVGPGDAKVSITPVGKPPKTYKLSEIKQAIFDARGEAGSRECDGVPWSRTEVGDSKKAGVAEINGNRIAFKDSSDGFKIGRPRRPNDTPPNDSCCFVFQQLDGDGEIIAKVLPGENTRWVRAGLMICEGLDGAGPMVLLSRTADPVEATLISRLKTGDIISTTPDARNTNTPAVWLKLTRTANVFKGYESFDGVKWIPITAERGAPADKKIPMDDKKGVYIGVAATGNCRDGTAQFEAIKLTGKRAVPALIGVGDSRLPDVCLYLQDGTVLAGKLESINKNQGQFKRAAADAKPMTIPVSVMARAQFEALTRDQANVLMKPTPGALGRDGDFLDGDIMDWAPTGVTISSIALGITPWPANRVLGLVFPTPAAGAANPNLVELRLADGSVIFGKTLTVNNDDVDIDEPLIGKFTVPIKEVLSIDRKTP